MDADDLELTRRRLEEQVKTKVETDLFRYYRNMGSIVIAVLGAVGIAIGWPALKGLIENQVEMQVAVQVKEPVEQAKSATEAASKTAREADKIANDVLERLEERQTQLREHIGRINVRYDDVEVNYGSAKARLNAINDQVSELEDAIQYFKELAKRDPVGRGELESLKASIADIAARAGELAKIIGENAGVGMSSEIIDTVQKGLEQVATDQNEAREALDQATILDPRGASTVFVQFAGGRREDIRAVTEILRNQGWTVPGEERIASAAGKREVRYFHESDKTAASSLRADLKTALRVAGFGSIEIGEIGEPTSVPKLPSRGILEVWLEIPVR